MAVRTKRAKTAKQVVDETKNPKAVPVVAEEDQVELEDDGLPPAEYYRLLSPLDYISAKEKAVKHGRSGDIVNDLPKASIHSWIMDNLIEKVWLRE